MPADEYKTASSGSLKLKGVNPSSKVSKHKKKRQKALENASSDTHANDTDKLKSTDDGAPATSKNGRAQRESDEKTLVEEQSVDGVDEDEDATSSQKMGKTEAELRHEERRRRRVGYIFLKSPLLNPHG